MRALDQKSNYLSPNCLDLYYSKAEMARLRLQAGCSIVKLAQEPVFADIITLEQFQSVAYLLVVSLGEIGQAGGRGREGGNLLYLTRVEGTSIRRYHHSRTIPIRSISFSGKSELNWASWRGEGGRKSPIVNKDGRNQYSPITLEQFQSVAYLLIVSKRESGREG